MQKTKPSENDIRRVVMASVVGATIEWYDFFLYGTAAALVFPPLSILIHRISFLTKSINLCAI